MTPDINNFPKQFEKGVVKYELLVNGRSEQSELQKWRHWLACQALQHYGDLDRLEWWHPVAETLAAGPELAARFEYEMEHAE